MSTMEMTRTDGAAMLERVVVGGDLSKLASGERLLYYRQVCESVGLNPLTRPFLYITLNGKLTLYASRDCTDQLRTLRHVSITKLERELTEGIYVVTAYAQNKDGRTDSSTGAVPIENLRGEARANAMMKAETKAKRRVTLSICGLGMLDETETDSIAGARPVAVDPLTGELPGAAAPTPPPMTAEQIFETPTEEAERKAQAAEDVQIEDAEGLLAAIVKGYAHLKSSPAVQVALWQKFCGAAPFLSPAADVAALDALLAELRAQARKSA